MIYNNIVDNNNIHNDNVIIYNDVNYIYKNNNRIVITITIPIISIWYIYIYYINNKIHPSNLSLNRGSLPPNFDAAVE